MLNLIWFAMLAAGIITAASSGNIEAVTRGIIQGSEQGVVVAFGLIGIISFWSGMMRIAEDAGLIKAFSRLVSPLASFLFPDVPKEHPAMGALLLSMSANFFGLGNACTPLGLKAMGELQQLNRNKAVASDAICTFMIVTSSSLTVIPSTIIALRSVHGSLQPTAIIGPIILATAVSTIVGVFFDKLLKQRSKGW